MKLDKLQSVRDAQRKVVENLFQKLDIAKENSMLEFRTILKSISTKAENLESLNTKIIEHLEVSEIENEIVNCEEYSIQLEIKLCKLREFDSRDLQPVRNNSSSSSDAQQSEIVPDLSGNSTSSVISSGSSHYNRLPKLSLPTFGENILQWQPFWDSFSTTVHTNPNLSDVQKFNYLRSQLESDAARKIEGFSFLNSNYIKAVEL